ncbi:MAG: phosphatase PAP2 family protein [Pirellulales bacterium]|nr:phosphatase PAP2 family protein [Pirellulales bacterium]
MRQGAGAWTYLIHAPTLWIPLAILCGATLIFRLTDADLRISRLFFPDAHSATEPLWPLGLREPWHWLYHFGVLPAWILGAGGLAVWLASWFWSKLLKYRDAGLFFALLLALGPGLLINGIFKPYWGRPRPNNTIPFGGPNEFLPVWTKGEGVANMSFPSGHASMGFYLMAPAFVLYRRRPGWAAAFLALGLLGGGLMGLTRIVAGSHFASDVLWSAGFVYFTGLGLAWLFGFGREPQGEREQGAGSREQSYVNI